MNQMGVVADAERLPWLTDDKKPKRSWRGPLLFVAGTLAALLVERAGRRVASAGNIGPTMLDTLAGSLDELPEAWVLELSSFQLDAVQGFEPSAAVVLNVTQDHLDWHGTMDAYAAAKARVYGERAVMIVNRDDPLVDDMVPVPAAAKAGTLCGSPAANTAMRPALPPCVPH